MIDFLLQNSQIRVETLVSTLIEYIELKIIRRMCIPKHQIIELATQQLLQSPREHLREDDKSKHIN